jgi:hypothetical protein
MLHPAFGVMSREELVFFQGHMETGRFVGRESSVPFPSSGKAIWSYLCHFND